MDRISNIHAYHVLFAVSVWLQADQYPMQGQGAQAPCSWSQTPGPQISAKVPGTPVEEFGCGYFNNTGVQSGKKI